MFLSHQDWVYHGISNSEVVFKRFEPDDSFGLWNPPWILRFVGWQFPVLLPTLWKDIPVDHQISRPGLDFASMITSKGKGPSCVMCRDNTASLRTSFWSNHEVAMILRICCFQGTWSLQIPWYMDSKHCWGLRIGPSSLAVSTAKALRSRTVSLLVGFRNRMVFHPKRASVFCFLHVFGIVCWKLMLKIWEFFSFLAKLRLGQSTFKSNAVDFFRKELGIKRHSVTGDIFGCQT